MKQSKNSLMKKSLFREVRKDDIRRTLKWVNDPNVTFYTGTTFPVSESENEEWWARGLSDKSRLFYSVIAPDGKHVGNIGLKNIHWVFRRAEIWLYIGENEYRKKGLGSEVFEEFVSHCFTHLNLHRIYGFPFCFNRISIKMLENCGFKKEGVLRDHIYRNGKYHDCFAMSILRNE